MKSLTFWTRRKGLNVGSNVRFIKTMLLRDMPRLESKRLMKHPLDQIHSLTGMESFYLSCLEQKVFLQKILAWAISIAILFMKVVRHVFLLCWWGISQLKGIRKTFWMIDELVRMNTGGRK